MKAFIHSTAEVNERVQAVLAKAKAVSGVSEGFEFRPLPDTHTPPMDYPVLSLGAYQRRGLERAVVTYSPAQIVSKADALTHLAHAFRVLAGQHDLPEFDYHVFEDDMDAAYFLDCHDQVFAVDIETKGDVDSQVPAWDEIISIGFYDGERAYIIPESLLDEPTVQDMVWHAIHYNTCILANGKFDLKYLGVKPKVFEDTMLMHYSLYPAASKHGLKDTAEELFGADDWDKAMKKQFLKKETVKAYEDRGDGAYAQAMSYTAQNGYERIPRDVLYKYNGLDVYWTYHVYMLLKEYMDNDPGAQRLYREHLMPLSDMYQDVETHGIRFDINYMIDLADTLTKEGEQLQFDLNEIAGRPVNPRSPKQVKEWFADQGVSTTTTAEAFLVEHIENAVSGITVDFARKLLELRKNAKMNGTYITGYLKQLIGDRGYPGYKLHASITGRLGGAGPSMLTIPRDKRIKKMVLPDEGHVVVASDLSQAELRVMAAESNDPWMLGAFQPDAGDFFDNLIMNTYPDLDLEKFKVEKPGEAKDMRARFKGVVYGTSFGRGAKAIAAAIGVTADEAQELIDAYVRPGSEFAQWRKDIARLATGAGVLSNPLGRKYQAEVVTYKNKANIERSGLSFPSQSTANDICLMAALTIHKRLAEQFPEARMMGTVHDCIYVSAPEHLAREIGYMLRDEMQGAGRKFYGDKVAFESVPEMGYNLGETKEFPEIGW